MTSGQQQWLERVDAALRSQGLAAAAALALEALADGVQHPALLNLAASAHHGEGRFAEAVELLLTARAMAPNDPNILNSLGICLKALGDAEGALRAYDEAIALDPSMAPAFFNRGAILESLSDIKGARSSYQRAAELNPDYAEPLAALAWLDSQAGNGEPARSNAERALKISPSNNPAQMALAATDLQSGDVAAAGARLAQLGRDPSLSQLNRSIVLGLIGDLHDAEGRPEQAFAAYQASNTEVKALNSARYEGPRIESPLQHALRLADWFESTDPGHWREAPPSLPNAGDPRTHVFLVGFPRSGTTLLENVLAAHPDVVTLEEKECLAGAAESFLASPEALERLARIDGEQAASCRKAYWSMVRSHGVEPGDKVFIDKMPLSSVLLPLIFKLFPDARILFARRDPRDVVLSCFRRRFGMNPSMYQLLTLDGAASYYDAVMRLSEIYRSMLPLAQHIVRYESLVDDFEGTARAACDFLGLQWDQAMLDFAEKARTRGISTPSAAQVARGLNRDGQGVWRRYADQMASVLPILEPWVDRFGYEA
jgi:tetratricopeptide (TPR) repeat protein